MIYFYTAVIATIILYNITLSILKDYINKEGDIGNKLIIGSILIGYITYALLVLCAQ